MKTLIIILIIATFLQTTILPMDLVLLMLICRAYIKPGGDNLYLAFAFGLFSSHLNLTSLGLMSLTYLIIVMAVQVLSRLNLAGNSLLIILITLVGLSLNQVINGEAVNWTTIYAALLSWPLLYLVRMWEERFIVRKEIKLKIK